MLVRRVLIVDDEQILRNLMTEILCRTDFQTVMVENGIEALRVLETDGEFDLVISDINMPKMGGLALLRELQQNYPDIPVLISSVDTPPPEIGILVQEGTISYLSRPFTARRLIDAANDAINRAR